MKNSVFFVLIFLFGSSLNAMSENQKIDAARIAMKITARAAFAEKQEKKNLSKTETQKKSTFVTKSK